MRSGIDTEVQGDGSKTVPAPPLADHKPTRPAASLRALNFAAHTAAGRPNLAAEEIKSLRARIWSLRMQHALAKRQARVKQAELIAGALEVEAAKLAELLSRSARRKRE